MKAGEVALVIIGSLLALLGIGAAVSHAIRNRDQLQHHILKNYQRSKGFVLKLLFEKIPDVVDVEAQRDLNPRLTRRQLLNRNAHSDSRTSTLFLEDEELPPPSTISQAPTLVGRQKQLQRKPVQLVQRQLNEQQQPPHQEQEQVKQQQATQSEQGQPEQLPKQQPSLPEEPIQQDQSILELPKPEQEEPIATI